MNKHIIPLIAALLPLAACSKCACGDTAQKDDAVEKTGEKKDEGKDGAEAPVDPNAPPEHVTFALDGWLGGRGMCSEGTQADGCDAEWRHAESKQLVRVFFIPLKDVGQLKGFMSKLQSDVTTRGGVAEEIRQGNVNVVRFLERLRQAVDGGAIDVASLNYAIVGRDMKGVHLVTSIVGLDVQEPADKRLRALIDTASWVR